MDPRDQLDTVLPLLTAMVASLDDAQLDAPTPCAAFAVRDVLGHMVGGATIFAAAFRGDAPSEPSSQGDVVSAFPVAMTDLQAAVRSPGALDRTIKAPFGEVPGDTFARFVALDGLVHAWDIATATGQAYDPPANLVAEVDAFAHQAISEDMRDGDTFAAAVDPPVGASPLVQLIAFTGRRV
ncbi:MAG: TIGR03086 family metal-binding protein [Acidimicrobiia bacterium]